jgi:hypothetical protein
MIPAASRRPEKPPRLRDDDGSEAMPYVPAQALAVPLVVSADNLDGAPPQFDLFGYDALAPR